MTYAFAPRGAPTVGKGLGGLPQRTDSEIVTTTVLGSCAVGDYVYTAMSGYPSYAFKSFATNGTGPAAVNFQNRVRKGSSVATPSIGASSFGAKFNPITNQFMVFDTTKIGIYNSNLTLQGTVTSTSITSYLIPRMSVNSLNGDFVLSVVDSSDGYKSKLIRYDRFGTLLGNTTIDTTLDYGGAAVAHHPVTGNILAVFTNQGAGPGWPSYATFYSNGSVITSKTSLVSGPAPYYSELGYNPNDNSWVYTYRDQGAPLGYAGYFLIQSGNTLVKSQTLFSNVANYVPSRISFNSSNGDFMVTYLNSSSYPSFQIFNKSGNVVVSETVVESVASGQVLSDWNSSTQQFFVLYATSSGISVKLANYSANGVISGSIVTLESNVAGFTGQFTSFSYIPNVDELFYFDYPNSLPTLNFATQTVSTGDYYISGISLDSASTISGQTVRILKSGTPSSLTADFRAANPKGVAIGTGAFK